VCDDTQTAWSTGGMIGIYTVIRTEPTTRRHNTVSFMSTVRTVPKYVQLYSYTHYVPLPVVPPPYLRHPYEYIHTVHRSACYSVTVLQCYSVRCPSIHPSIQSVHYSRWRREEGGWVPPSWGLPPGVHLGVHLGDGGRLHVCGWLLARCRENQLGDVHSSSLFSFLVLASV
jgi:hypothetical protein